MGFWSFYFFAKILMFCAGFIGFHLIENLALALWVALPVAARRWRIAKHLLAAPAAIALLYYDSWLPSWRRLLAQSDQVAQFSWAYFLELAPRFLNYRLLLGLALLLAIYWLLSRKLRLSSFAFLGIALSPALGALTGVNSTAAPGVAGGVAVASGQVSSTLDLDAALEQFYRSESGRVVSMTRPADDGRPFDLLLIQVCSLAWDDLDTVNAREHPLLSQFHLRFDNFNAGASYSGPAAIRLLRASCGHAPHDALYRPANPACYLMDNLRAAGFAPHWAMNHDGVYGPMSDDIVKHGNIDVAQLSLQGLAPALRAFEGSLYHDDYAVLSRWWRERLRSPAERVALYYNSGYLHDGNRFLDGSSPGTVESYRRRAQAQLAGIGRFLDEVEASGRRTIVVLVPEHGANVRGDRLQVSGLREIPSPAIGLVPVGVRLTGKPLDASPLLIKQPSGLHSLASLLAAFTTVNPFAPGAPPLDDYARNLPVTEFVAENDGVVVMRLGGRYWMRDADRRWSEYRADTSG